MLRHCSVMNHILFHYLTKYRIAHNITAHQLKIETGRYSRNHADRKQRLCTICECNDIEDEYHFILIFPIYRNIRKKYINVNYTVNNVNKCNPFNKRRNFTV